MRKFGFVVFAIVLSLFVASSSSFSSATEELEGTLEVIMITEIAKKTCEPLYFINVGGKRTQFSPPAHAPLLSPGQPIKISGRWEESADGKKRFRCRKVATVATVPIAPKTASAADSAGDYLPKQYPVLGEQKVLIVCLNFPGTENESPVWGEEKIDDKIFSNSHSLNAYWQACSIDNKTGESKVRLTGDVLDKGNWKTMPKSLAEYGYGSDDEEIWFYQFKDDMIKLIDKEIDFSKSKYDGLIVFRAGKMWKYDWSTGGKWSVSTDEGEVEISMSFLSEEDIDIDNDYAAHESGHGLFSLFHANSMSILSGKIHRYGDWWDNRGGNYALLDGLHRWKLGWLDISQIEIVYGGYYRLDQKESASGGTKLLIIPLGFDVYRDPILIYMEYHRGLGEFDSQLSFFNKNEAVDPNNIVLYKKYIWQETGDSLVFVASDNGNDCLDIESKEFSDEENKIRVQVLKKTGEGANSQAEVKVTLAEGYSFPTPYPTPTPCRADILRVSPGPLLKLAKKTSEMVTVTVMGADDCAVEGETVTAIVTSASGQKRISISPSSGKTDKEGQVVFTITAAKKLGNATVSFRAGNLETLLTVKVSRK